MQCSVNDTIPSNVKAGCVAVGIYVLCKKRDFSKNPRLCDFGATPERRVTYIAESMMYVLGHFLTYNTECASGRVC